MHLFQRALAVIHRGQTDLQHDTTRAITRTLERLVILCSSADEANYLQVHEARPTLVRSGITWAQDSLYRLRDGRQVEFYSARGTLWWNKLSRPNMMTIVVPLYRRDDTLDPYLRAQIDNRLLLLSRSVMVLDVLPEEL